MTDQSNTLTYGTPVTLLVDQSLQHGYGRGTGMIRAVVAYDVYSADGTKVLIAADTPAFIEYTVEPNGLWGKAGKIMLTGASTTTVDNQRVALRLGCYRSGSSRLGCVIVLSILLFPMGLLSGCIKGSMPSIRQGTSITAAVIQDVTVE